MSVPQLANIAFSVEPSDRMNAPTAEIPNAMQPSMLMCAAHHSDRPGSHRVSRSRK